MTCVTADRVSLGCCHLDRHGSQVAQFGGQEECRILLDAAFDEHDDAWGSITHVGLLCAFVLEGSGAAPPK